jgi:hypothetical protein
MGWAMYVVPSFITQSVSAVNRWSNSGYAVSAFTLESQFSL